MNAEPQTSCMDDARIRVNVSRTPNELAIMCVMTNREDGADIVAPILLPISNEHDAPDALNSMVSRGTGMERAEQLCMALIMLLLKALARGYTGHDPFVRHMTLALFAMCRRHPIYEPHAAESVPGGLKPWQRVLAASLLGSEVSPTNALSEVARRCGLSTAHFCRAFAKSFGLPPYRWMLVQRLEKARLLLAESGRSLADIAYECGFCDQSHLNHAFSRWFGLSPGAWRRDHRPSRDMQAPCV
jgi:AraC-like DNA-binding protein